MNVEEYKKLRQILTRKRHGVSDRKRDTYAGDEDVLSNFRDGADFSMTTPSVYLFDLMAKHVLRVRDEVLYDKKPSLDAIGDIMNYLELLVALNYEVEEVAEWQPS